MKNETHYILSDNPAIVQDVEVIRKVRSSGHSIVRCKLRLNFRRERRKLVKTKKPRTESVRAGSLEFEIILQSKSLLLKEENEVRVDRLNENLTSALIELATAVGEVTCKQENGKLAKKTKELIAKRKNMTVSSPADQIDLSKLSKLMNRSKTNEIHAKHTTFVHV